MAEEQGGYLATITSSEENNFVFELIDHAEFWYKTGPDDIGPWIGGYQPTGSAEPEGGWTWGSLHGQFSTSKLIGEMRRLFHDGDPSI